ncbi:hypothetical protein [Kitasatospora sp. NPDC101183]|uniref:hypothetical protein n=1 Tax=Kitasatospora sp. NPDC101183 TaxID=3364100 RepID=UPI0038006494
MMGQAGHHHGSISSSARRRSGAGAPCLWEDLYFRQVGEVDYHGLRKVVREVLGHLDRDGRRRAPDPRFLHLKDVIIRSGRTSQSLPLWRGPIAAVSGWSLGGPDER